MVGRRLLGRHWSENGSKHQKKKKSLTAYLEITNFYVNNYAKHVNVFGGEKKTLFSVTFFIPLQTIRLTVRVFTYCNSHFASQKNSY